MNIIKNLIKKLFFNPLLLKLNTSRTGRSIFYDAQPKNKLLIAETIEGINYVVRSADEAIGRYSFREKKSYDSQHLIVALGLVGTNKNILIDIGANIGTIGIFAISQNLCNKCIAFEPEPINFNLLSANVSLNGLNDRFELHNEALSNEFGKSLSFELDELNYGDHRVRINDKSGSYGEENRKIINVPSNSLDNACVDVDLNDCIIFMDTQGFEGHILSGAKSFIDAKVPMVTEFWPYGLNRAGGLDMFYSALESANYTTIYDLRMPEKKIEFSITAIKKIANGLGEDYADLLFK